MDLDNSAINESIFKVRAFTHHFEKTLEYTGLGPPAKPPELAVPMPSDRPMAWAERPRAGARLEGAARELDAFIRINGKPASIVKTSA